MPLLRNTCAAIGTKVFTGFVTIPIQALGQISATFSTRFLIIPALILKRSARVIPGLRASPAVISTICASSNALSKSSPA